MQATLLFIIIWLGTKHARDLFRQVGASDINDMARANVEHALKYVDRLNDVELSLDPTEPTVTPLDENLLYGENRMPTTEYTNLINATRQVLSPRHSQKDAAKNVLRALIALTSASGKVLLLQARNDQHTNPH